MRIRLLSRFLPALVLMALPLCASAGVFVGVSVDVPPPPLPVYVQPPCPQPGYIWVPGYWAWGPYGYYWVPGTWVLPPQVGLLWTPGYWGWDGAAYLWHAGYWGPSVGFYGGIDYGFGYDGDGFDGGFWRGGIFFYNRAVMRLGRDFGGHDYYRRPAPRPYFDRGRFRHISFNGGRDGILARPNHRDRRAERERRFGRTPDQRRHAFMARGDLGLRANYNHGRPSIAATARAGRFRGRGVIAARAAGGPYFHHGARPTWAARRHNAAQRHRNGQAARFTAHHGGPVFQGMRHPTHHQAFRFAGQPVSRAAPRFHGGPAPHFQAHRPMPHFQAHRPVPHFQARRPISHFQARRPMPHFQARRPMPHFQARRPMPHFQPHRPTPHFQARPAHRFQRRPAPHFQRHQPRPHFQARRQMSHFQVRRPRPQFQALHAPLLHTPLGPPM